MSDLNKRQIADMLKEGIRTVKFTKVDGTERTMKCTLMESYLPEQVDIEEYVARDQNNEVCAVWDVEAEGWRSFRIASIIEIV